MQIICPRCGAIDTIKNGKSHTGIQRFKCVICLKRFQVDRAPRKSQLSNAEILELKEKGLSLSKIAALAGVSKNAIAKRLKPKKQMTEPTQSSCQYSTIAHLDVKDRVRLLEELSSFFRAVGLAKPGRDKLWQESLLRHEGILPRHLQGCWMPLVSEYVISLSIAKRLKRLEKR